MSNIFTFTLSLLMYLGIIWTALNLLPIKPLDGYGILENLISIINRQQRPKLTLKISLFFALIVTCTALYFGLIIMTAFLGYMAYQIKRELDIYK